MLAGRNDVKDAKVILGEECVLQHKLVVMSIKRSTKEKAKGTRDRLNM